MMIKYHAGLQKNCAKIKLASRDEIKVLSNSKSGEEMKRNARTAKVKVKDKAKQSKAKQRKAKQSKAKQSKAKQGKAKHWQSEKMRCYCTSFQG